MKIGIVGCGLNSDYHINFARAYKGAVIVGVVDRDRERAAECGRRHNISGVYESISELVEKGAPEVIHVLTPPKTHYEVAKEAISAGCHVLVEKPMALNAGEAAALFDLAESKGVKLCAMHNHMFDPCMQRIDRLVKEGSAGRVVNVESYYGLNTRIPAFRDYPSPNVLPWLYGLPGSVYHDFMPHPLYVLLEYTGRPKSVNVAYTSNGVLPQGMPDEIRVLVEGERCLGTLTFSFAARPHLHFIRVYGTKMMGEVDINTMTSVVHPVSGLPKAAQKATYNLSAAWQLTRNTFSNVLKFVTKKLKPYQGMKDLIHRYYDAIKAGAEPPVSKEQALNVIEAMDEIWGQLPLRPLDFSPIPARVTTFPLKKAERVLVTGGTGFLGKNVVEHLVKEGYPVRVLARKLSDVEPLKALGVEILYGDVADTASLGEAAKGMDVIVHAAAGTSGDKKDCDTATIQGTKNVIEVVGSAGVKKLVYISSCSVYGVADYKKDELVTEDSTLERFPSKRGEYSSSKQAAEALVSSAVADGGLPAIILRPGTIYGPGGDVYTPMLGFSAPNTFIVIGNGRFELPFVYIDNLSDAVVKSIESDDAVGKVFNVVDGERLTKRAYMTGLMKRLHPRARVLYFPFGLLYSIVFGQEILCRLMRRGPFLTRYRLISSQRNIRYDNSRIKKVLGWEPQVTFKEAVQAIVDYEKKR